MIDIRTGFIPLLDCAPVVVASAMGFAEAEGLALTLVRETSWATLRDRIAVRQLDVAHMLAPMPIAANLGLTPLPVTLVAPLALGAGGNTVTVSAALWQALAEAGAPADFAAAPTASAFATVVLQRAEAGLPRLTIAIVHPFSMHHYQLAYWLASVGIVPGRDVSLVVVAPQMMSAALAGAQIDAFCAGEPWGSVAVAEGAGQILTTGTHIWPSSPEKVLGMRQSWAEEAPDRLARLLRAIVRAAHWCDDPANGEALVQLLARPDMLDQPVAHLLPGRQRRLTAPSGQPETVDGLLSFTGPGRLRPALAHARWIHAQMVRWDQVPASPDGLAAAQASFRPDLGATALAGAAGASFGDSAADAGPFFDGQGV
jgi:two-component system, oxyanion-binding sensor